MFKVQNEAGMWPCEGLFALIRAATDSELVTFTNNVQLTNTKRGSVGTRMLIFYSGESVCQSCSN